MTTVSVIIPVYNGAHHVGEAIESVLAQDYPLHEIIVADDGSTDDSPAVARSYPGVTVLQLEHAGVSATRNAAVAASSGEWLGFLDADDWWLPGKIRAQVEIVESGTTAGIILCERVHVFEEVPAWFTWPTNQVSKTSFEPSSWLIKRSTFDMVGGFTVGRALGEDMNWLLRAWSLGVTQKVARETLLKRRIHGSNASAALPSAEVQMMDLLRESLAIKKAMKADAEAAHEEGRGASGHEASL